MFLQVSVCPQGGLVPRGCLLPGCLLLGGPLLGGLVSQHALRQTPLGETATAADGAHPTGMHSCLDFMYNLLIRYAKVLVDSKGVYKKVLVVVFSLLFYKYLR